MNRIEDLESLLEQGLSKLRAPEYKALQEYFSPLLQPGYRPRVSARNKETHRKMRKNASASSWEPEFGEFRITFEPGSGSVASEPGVSPGSSVGSPVVTRPSETAGPKMHEAEKGPAPLPENLCDLVRHLDRAESKPGYGFVALKWFRDTVLPAVRTEWASAEARSAALREAIERRLVLTCKVPNPRSPEYPVTAVRLNRSLLEVTGILGMPQTANEFQPIKIRGEGLSATILRERR